MNIILIGFRGTGKTTVGRLLAQSLRLPFFDTDTFIQEETGKTIRDIVATEGWFTFRQLEKNVIGLLSLHDNCVIALGGGAILDPENVRRLQDKGFFVWLTAGLNTILERLTLDDKTKDVRPSLTDRDLVEETGDLLILREPYYQQIANVVISTEGKGPEEVVNDIIFHIKHPTGGNQ
ncbi:MAG: shikimate kinase [Syntrophales bacterium]|nr:shikimate kinase [Syntrophales bacterium]